MPDGVLTLQPGARLWFEGEAWEVEYFLADQVRLRRGATVRSVSTSALLAAGDAVGAITDLANQLPLRCVEAPV